MRVPIRQSQRARPTRIGSTRRVRLPELPDVRSYRVLVEEESVVVIELVMLRTKASVTDEAFLAAAAQAHEFLKGREGFLRRRLAKDEDGKWVDYVEWATMPEALAAARSFNASAATQAFNAAIEPGSVSMRHFTVRLG
jgi:hypothetical protein